MSRNKEDNVLAEAIGSMRHLVRHRGSINLFGHQIDQVRLGKKVFYFDNHIPALLEDVFNNRGYEQKDGTKPVLAARRKTAKGWLLVWQLPPGVSFSQIKRDREFFQDAVNAWIEMEWQHGKLYMTVQPGDLPGCVPYEFDHSQYKMHLPVPVGWSRGGLVTFDLTESPHMLIGGTTGYGKTNALRCIIHALLPLAYVVIIDLKQLDFHYLDQTCLVAYTAKQATQLLQALNSEYDRRIQLLKAARVAKIQEYKEALPYIVVVIDELAEVPAGEPMELLDRLVRLARATGISLIVGSQRTSTRVLSGDTRANFVARLCFKVPSPADSRVVLGEDCGLAGEIAPIKGRCIFRFGLVTQELQAQNLPLEAARALIPKTIQGRWQGAIESKPQAKRLAAR